MFGRKNGSSDIITTATDKLSIVAEGATFRGDLETGGNLRIDGKIAGHVTSTGNVAIGRTGYVEGDVNAAMLKVSGRIKGNITVSGRLLLDSTATVFGDVKTKVLMVEEGASVTGKLAMESQLPPEAEAEFAKP